MTTPKRSWPAGWRIRALVLLGLVLALILMLRHLGASGQAEPQAAMAAAAARHGPALAAADLVWPIHVLESPGSVVARDPFQRGPASDAAGTLPGRLKPVQVTALPSAAEKATPSPSPAPSERERAQADLDALRLTGMVVREGQVFALLLQGDRFHSLRLGERIDQRFQVTVLDAVAIELLDPATGAHRRISALGS